MSRWQPTKDPDKALRGLLRRKKRRRKAEREALAKAQAKKKHQHKTRHRRQDAVAVELDRFWREAVGRTAKERLELLRAMSKLRFGQVSTENLTNRRNVLDRIKWRIGVNGTPCFVCSRASDHRHHVVQLQHGGHNGRRNIVILCLGCHEEIHPHMIQRFASEEDFERALDLAAAAGGLEPEKEQR